MTATFGTIMLRLLTRSYSIAVILLLGVLAIPGLSQCGPGQTRRSIGAGQYSCVNTSSVVVRDANGNIPGAIGGGSSIPSGAILLLLSGACPTGFTETDALDGFMLR